MKNITFSVDEEVLQAARQYAASMNSSVNALLRAYLTELANRKNAADGARKRIRAMSARSTARIGSGSWKREDLYRHL